MTTSKTQAKTLVKSLIDKYNRYKKQGLLKKYNEDNTCKDFILPLFSALGWGIRTSKEVEGQKKVSRGWVDYAFYLDEIPKFYLEAKAIPEDLNNPKYIKQAIDYAYNKGVTWAVLSNFEGIKVFNSEWHTDPLKACVLNISIDDYLKDFDLLWELSEEGFKKDLLYQRARKFGQVAIKEPVGERLYGDLTKWRELFFKYITVYHKNFTFAQVDEIIQRILNRLVFIRICEDRKIEQLHLLPLVREWEANKRKYRLEKKVQELFRNFDKWYDSKLFLEHACDQMDTEDNPYKEVIEGLYGSRDGIIKYDFNAIGVDVLGRVYEQYLGYVAKTVEPEKKKQLAFKGFEELIRVKKEKGKREEHGIYYTPKYIVDYIVQNTLGKFIKERTHNEILNVKVLDSACGSGSFLIAAYDLLDKYNAQIKNKEEGDFFDKIRILNQNIYGVDLDPQAAEITQLNLLIKTLNSRRKLPILKNIKEGNSLISGYEKELKLYFGKDWKEKKPLDWQREFSEIFKNGGFDIVIGNPPYVSTVRLSKAGFGREKEFYGKHFISAHKGYDLYVLFVERALNLLRNGGRLGFIIPNKFMSTDYGEKLREFILGNCVLEQIVDVSNYPVFRDAAIYPIIIILKKEKSAKDRSKNKILLTRPILLDYNSIEVQENYISQRLLENAPRHIFATYTNPKVELINKKIEKNSTFLKEICSISSGTTGFDYQKYGSLITDEPKKTNKHTRKFIITRNVEPFLAIWGERINYLKKAFHHPYFIYDKQKVTDGKWLLFNSKKIVIRGMAKSLTAGLDEEGFALGVGVYALTSIKINPKYLLAILNSRLMDFYYKGKFASKHLAGGYLGFNVGQLELIPVRMINKNNEAIHQKLIKLSDEIIKAQKKLQKETKLSDRYTRLKEEVKDLNKQIDQQVYKLYGLTEKEIKIVEKNENECI